MVDGIYFNPFTQKALTPEEIQQIDANRDGKVTQEEFEANIVYLSQDVDDEGIVAIEEPSNVKPSNAPKRSAEQTSSQPLDADSIKETIAPTLDVWLEDTIKPYMSEDTRDEIIYLANGAWLDEFVEQVLANGGAVNTSDFESHLDSKFNDYTAAKELVEGLKNPADTSRSTDLRDDAMTATENGYVSNTEKAGLIDGASGIILQQMLNGEDVQIFSALDQNYKTSTEYSELKSIVNDLSNATTKAEVERLKKEALAKIEEILNKYSGENIANAIIGGVGYHGSYEVGDAEKNAAIQSNNELFQNYNYNGKGKTITSDYVDFGDGADNGKKVDISNQPSDVQEAYNKVVEQAKKDLQTYAEALKSQLKAKYGSKYDEANVQKCIDSAINATILEFRENSRYLEDAVDGGNYQVTTSDQIGFNFLERSHSKGRFGYNTQALINTFNKHFNAESIENKEGNEIYDKEDVIENSGVAQTYATNNRQVGTKEDAEAYLKSLGESLKSTLIANGCELDSTKLDSIIEEAINGVLSFDNLKPVIFSYLRFEPQELTSKFFDEFDKLYKEATSK